MQRISPLMERNRAATGGNVVKANVPSHATGTRLAKDNWASDSRTRRLSSLARWPRVSPSLRIRVTLANRSLLRWMREAEMAAWEGT
ncbi:MAG: hypothetical protein KIS67_07770 [Verrucomicrobiae bacterium]|nr:hypothetical protein [Verrucomicrobiae bacterium]